VAMGISYGAGVEGLQHGFGGQLVDGAVLQELGLALVDALPEATFYESGPGLYVRGFVRVFSGRCRWCIVVEGTR